MNRQRKIRIAAIVAAALFIIVAAAGSLSRSSYIRQFRGEDKVALITVSGPIVGGGGMAWNSGDSASSQSLMRQFRQARRDDAVRAVLLRINSPGGSAAATQEAAAELARLKAAGKPVVVSMGDSAASGAYWLAAYGDKIYANPSTITGSIGVYMAYYDLQGLSEKLGVSEEKIKSGAHKDIFSPFRPMTDEERRLTQDMVDSMYEQFVAVVARERHMDEASVRSLADGRVFTGEQAKAAGLVDELGNYYDALAYAGSLIGADPDDVPLVTYDDGLSLRQLISGAPAAGETFARFVYGTDMPLPLLLMKGAWQQ